MRVAVIFGLGSSAADLEPFQSVAPTEWIEGLPASPSDADVIIIFGGDGTIHRHLPSLVRLQLPVLIVPTGSGNDFARALKLRSIRDSLYVWRAFESGQCKARAVDLGVILPSADPQHLHYFCCVAGCGLDSAAARSANAMPRWLRSHGGYVLALLPLLLNLPAFSFYLRLTQAGGSDLGQSSRRTLLAAFANTQFYGDGMRIAPQADFMDGLLDICRVGMMNPFKLFFVFPTVYLGRHLSSPHVEYSKAKGVKLETDTPTDIYADGEFVCQTPAEISVVPAALQVLMSV